MSKFPKINEESQKIWNQFLMCENGEMGDYPDTVDLIYVLVEYLKDIEQWRKVNKIE